MNEGSETDDAESPRRRLGRPPCASEQGLKPEQSGVTEYI